MMNRIPLLLFLLLLLTACRKSQTYICSTPQILLQPEGFTEAEWDTVITRVYNPDFKEPYIADTFLATALDDVLLITPYTDDEKDFEVFLPSINKSYRLYDIVITPRTEQGGKNDEPECYHDINMMLDGTVYTFSNTKLPLVKLFR